MCGRLSVCAHVCFYPGPLSMSAAAMSVFNGVCGNNYLIVALPPFEEYERVRASACEHVWAVFCQEIGRKDQRRVGRFEERELKQ